MALNASLTVEGREYNILDLDYRLTQPTDTKGKPSGITTGGLINFTVNASKQDDFFFHEWVTSLSTVKSGRFTLPITDGIEHLETYVYFEDAYCTDLQVTYGNLNERQVYMRITISATVLAFGAAGTVEYHNQNLETK